MNNTDELIITVRTLTEAAVEEEFNEWQFEEHVPWILSVEGYENVRRYKDTENEHRYVNIWGLTDFAGHDCEDHERKSKSPWGRRLKRYRTLQVDFYHKLTSTGTLPSAGPDSLLLLRFDPKGSGCLESGEEAAAAFGALPFAQYTALYARDRGQGGEYMLRVHFDVPEFLHTQEVRAIIRKLSGEVCVTSREVYKAMADTAYSDEIQKWRFDYVADK